MPEPIDAAGEISEKTRARGAIRKIVVDRVKCIGAKSCVAMAPGVFAMDKENLAFIVDPNAADEDTLLMAAQSCPVLAITLYDKNKKIIFPQ